MNKLFLIILSCSLINLFTNGFPKGRYIVEEDEEYEMVDESKYYSELSYFENLKRKLNKKKKKRELTVTATMYNAVVNQCDEDPLVTAGMFKINPNKASQHKWIAMSRNLLRYFGGKFKYGDKVKIIGCGRKSGIYTVVDTMNERYFNRIDILETVGTPLYKYKNVRVYKV